MCIYDGVLGSGPAFWVQMLTLIAIAASISSWVWAYRRLEVPLRPYALPIILWILFGSLDIMITARGTFDAPYREGNPLARLVFIQSGPAGPVVATVLWIALWSGIVLALNKRFGQGLIVRFISLAVFYSVAAGHLFGFSSWFIPLCPIAQGFGLVRNLFGLVLIGCLLSAAHSAARGFWDKLI